MPQVPRREEGQVPLRALPDIRVPTEAPAGAFGGGPAAQRLAQETKGFAKDIQRAALKMSHDAEDIAVLEADNEISKWEQDYLNNAETGALRRKGKDALNISGEYTEDLGNQFKTVSKNLSPRGTQKLRARQIRREQNGRAILEKHGAREYSNFRNEQIEASIKGYQSQLLLVFDKEHARKEIFALVDMTIDDWARYNFAPEARPGHGIQAAIKKEATSKQAIEGKRKGILSSLHVGVVSQYLAVQSDREAEAYFSKIKEELTPKDFRELKDSIEEGGFRGSIQRETDKIISSYNREEEDLAGERQKALAKARRLTGKIEDGTIRALKDRFAEDDRLKKLKQADLYENAARLSEAAPGSSPRDLVSPKAWMDLTPEHRQALESRARIRAGGEVPNNNRAWLEYWFMDPRERAALSMDEFESKYWTKFDASHRSRAESLLQAAKTGGREVHATTLSFKDRVDNTLRTSRMVPQTGSHRTFSRSKAELYTRFEQEASKQVEEFERQDLAGKRKATGQEIQGILDKMVVNKVFVEGGAFSFDREVPVDILGDEDRGEAFVPWDQITNEDRQAISRILKANNRVITRSLVERAKAAQVMNDRELFDKITGANRGE